MKLNLKLIRSALAYLQTDNCPSTDMAHGVIVGVVTTVMAMGKSYDETIAMIMPLLPEQYNADAIPPAWRSSFPEEN